ncbi:MAG: NAD-dependent epimerase/dehydratase family protein [Sandaracinaceae bacterium]|nr:NAD-dependent epimerase/dehydratase family protein [Sandaracinaceae bacterium]
MTGVLVTGASTPVGQALVESLMADPRVERVLAVAAEPRWQGASSTKLTYLHADLSRSRHLRRLLFGPARDLSIGAVVHGALHRHRVQGGQRIHRLNVESTREMLHLCERHPTIRRFVFRSTAEVYRVRPENAGLLGEEHPLELGPGMPQGVRDRVEADITVCMRMGLTGLSIVVLRCAEILAPGVGSQLFDYLNAEVCFRPLGFDPMLHVLSIEDAVEAMRLAVHADAQGVLNVPGADVLPLSRAIALTGRPTVPVPGPLLGPIYGLRAWVRGAQFRYGLNRWRLRFSGVLDGTRAAEVLGFEPSHPVAWDRLVGPR